jgi:ubiquinone/menaquinone biosynthesis C-methylase UbiE
MKPNFDRIARPYRWLEYLTFGKALQNCRTHFLSELHGRRNALIIGDGDGRFTSQLLTTNPSIEVLAIDTSATMLNLLRRRCTSNSSRLRTIQQNALDHIPSSSTDLIVTHFFLDCLSQPELDTLINRITPNLTPGTLWVISDFRIPEGPLRLPAKLLIRTLYLGFRLITALRTNQLPDHTTPLIRAGLIRTHQQTRLAGLLTTELWRI